jgi:hypothetical protein
MAKTNCPGFYAVNSSNNGLLQIARVEALWKPADHPAADALED